MPIYHNKYKTTQHKIGEREPIDHYKYGFGLEWGEKGKGGKAWGHGLDVDQRKQKGIKRDIIGHGDRWWINHGFWLWVLETDGGSVMGSGYDGFWDR